MLYYETRARSASHMYDVPKTCSALEGSTSPYVDNISTVMLVLARLFEPMIIIDHYLALASDSERTDFSL